MDLQLQLSKSFDEYHKLWSYRWNVILFDSFFFKLNETQDWATFEMNTLETWQCRHPWLTCRTLLNDTINLKNNEWVCLVRWKSNIPSFRHPARPSKRLTERTNDLYLCFFFVKLVGGRLKPTPIAALTGRPESANRCADCDSPFSVMRRKHHCHACGKVHITYYSSRRIETQYIDRTDEDSPRYSHGP